MRSASGRVCPAIFIVFAFLLLLNSCTSYEEEQKNWPDTWKRGTIHISVDESFKPIIDAQVQVYEANQPGTKIIVHYKPEAECLKDFATLNLIINCVDPAIWVALSIKND